MSIWLQAPLSYIIVIFSTYLTNYFAQLQFTHDALYGFTNCPTQIPQQIAISWYKEACANQQENEGNENELSNT